VLTAPLLLLIALCLLSGLSLVSPAVARHVPLGVAVAGAGFALLGIVALVAPDPVVWTLPFGPPGLPVRLALDGLSAWFLMLVGLVALAAGLGAPAAAPRRMQAALPLFLAGMVMTLLAADAATLLAGFEAMSLASFILVVGGQDSTDLRLAARRYLMFAALSVACLVPALGLMAAGAGDLGFAALRRAPPEGLVAACVMALVLVGAGSKAGLWPLHVWLPPAHAAAPAHVSALMSAAMTKVAAYVLARLLLDLAGPAQPLWFGVPLLVLGIVSAVAGALRANLEEDAKRLLACSTIENLGLILAAFGLALCFRAADLSAFAAMAAGAGLLLALAHAMFKTALFLAAGAVLQAAGSRRLDALGGLIHRMPWTAALALVGVLAAAGLPPLSGFAAEWLLLQGLLGAWRVGDLAFQLLGIAALAGAGLAVALGAAAMLRLFAMVFLGRPRTPRAAGALEAPAPLRAALLLTGFVTLLVGLFPGGFLALGAPALALLVRREADAGALALAAPEQAAHYAPLLAVGLLLAAGLLVRALIRRAGAPALVRGPAWDCGFAAPPPDLPFGDPATQPSAAGLAQPLRRMLGQPLLVVTEVVTMAPPGSPAPARLEAGFADPLESLALPALATARDRLAAGLDRLRDLTLRQALMLPFGALVALLALVAWLEAR